MIPIRRIHHVVKIEGMAFKLATLNVKRGDVVVWENADVVPHTVTEPGKFDSKTIAAGSKWSWKASGTGRHDYVCTFHPGMKGTVVVGE